MFQSASDLLQDEIKTKQFNTIILIILNHFFLIEAGHFLLFAMRVIIPKIFLKAFLGHYYSRTLLTNLNEFSKFGHMLPIIVITIYLNNFELFESVCSFGLPNILIKTIENCRINSD